MILLPFLAAAQEGKNAFTILRLPYSSRAAALGGKNISVVDDDITMAIHNPALLANVADKTIDLTFMTYMSDSKIAGAMFNKAFGERSTGAISARHIDYGKFEGYTEDNIYTGTFSAKDIELSLMYSYLLGERWSGGVTGKFIYSKYESMSAVTLGVDLGINYFNAESDLSLSLALKNLGGQVKAFEEKHETMPFDIQFGITKRLAHAPILISATFTDLHRWQPEHFYNADGSKDNFGELLLKHIILGADILIGKNVDISVGYNYRMAKELSTGGSRLDGITAGAGLHINKVKFGVSYSKLHVSSSSLLFNLSYSL
ncbi:MAG: type IX secretion system protein PorQ [Bacteroidaceae bacterium]|nr:type IX secretion system protein PorQ [Bacteroidaceae bacterium]